MRIKGYLSRLTNEQPTLVTMRRVIGCLGVAILCMTVAVAVAVAQDPAAPAPARESMSIPAGYSAHHSIDIGGRLTDQVGSGQMYDTMVNLKSGPRVQGETLELHALPGKAKLPVDDMTIFGSGFGGDPLDVIRLNATKGKLYEFSGLFRRDRQYFDYDLLGNVNIPYGYSIPISGSATPYAWPQQNSSPFMFNTVRRMTDTNLTLLPLSTITFRFAYSKNIFQGPSTTPSGNSVAGSALLLEEYQRNSTDDFTGAVDWKPVKDTKLTFEEQVDHYKGDSFFSMAPQYFTAQESDGTKVALLTSYASYVPYGYTSAGAFAPNGSYTTKTVNGVVLNTITAGVCGLPTTTGTGGPATTSSALAAGTILYANPNGGLPIIDPACNVVSSYVRNQPTREIFPTEIFRLQSTSIKNIAMNGNFRYTSANMNMPNYYEDFNGLDTKAPTDSQNATTGALTVTSPGGGLRSIAYNAYANAKRETVAVEYGVVWRATKTVALEDQFTYSNVHQPGNAEFTGETAVTTSIAAGQDTINSTGLTTLTAGGSTCVASSPLVSCSSPFTGGAGIGALMADYFGQKLTTNNATVTWDAGARSTFSLTYHYSTHLIGEGDPHSAPLSQTCLYSSDPACGTVTINENGGILTAALHPANNWDLNGSIEMIYDDNVFTPVAPRETQHYRVHTIYRPKTWATISGAFNDRERHNNTNNTGTASAEGPLGHVDHSRVFSVGAELNPNEHYGLDLNYSYSDVYASTNTCYFAEATLMPGGTVAPAPSTTTGTACPGGAAGEMGPVKDFQDAPTQFLSAAVMLSPNTKMNSNIGYRTSDVNGSRFFNDARDVNGTLVSNFQTPFVNVAWTVHPAVIVKGEYDYYDYGEGGRSGAQWCNTSATATAATPVLCSTLPNTSMYAGSPIYGFTAPRNFHANNLTLGIHYEF